MERKPDVGRSSDTFLDKANSVNVRKLTYGLGRCVHDMGLFVHYLWDVGLIFALIEAVCHTPLDGDAAANEASKKGIN